MSDDGGMAYLMGLRGRQVTGTIKIRGKIVAVKGRLDAVGVIEDKLMLAIGDDEGDGEIHFVPNEPGTEILIAEVG